MQLGVRTAGDFDILTDPLTAEEIFSHLQNIGLQKDYQTCNRDDYNKTYMHHLTPLYSNNGRVYIEIHHRLNLSFDSYIPNTTDMITRKRIIDINGESIPINSLEDCMYVVCYNMYMDQHYIHSYSLKPYASIIALTKKVDFNKLLSIVTTDKCIFPVSYALYCADYLYKFMTGNYLLTDKIKKDFCFDEFHDQFNYIRHHMAFSNDILGKWGSEFPLEDRVFMQALSLNPKAQAFFDHKIAQYFFRQHWVTAVNKLPDGYFDIYSHWEYVDPII